MPSYIAHNAHVFESREHAQTSPKSRGKLVLFWGAGGTILSALGFVALALFEQYNGMISELRNDLKHFNETSSEYVKKDSFQRLRDHIRETTKELQALTMSKSQLEQALKESVHEREEMVRELHLVREKLAFLEGRQVVLPSAPSAAKTSAAR